MPMCRKVPVENDAVLGRLVARHRYYVGCLGALGSLGLGPWVSTVMKAGRAAELRQAPGKDLTRSYIQERIVST